MILIVKQLQYKEEKDKPKKYVFKKFKFAWTNEPVIVNSWLCCMSSYSVYQKKAIRLKTLMIIL